MEKIKFKPKGTDSAKIIKVIVTESAIGDGTEENPVRTIYQYWDFKGNLIAKRDTLITDDLFQ